jgi:hypothetical protein
MTERERISLMVQILGLGVVLWIGLGSFSQGSVGWSWLNGGGYLEVPAKIFNWLPIILTLGLIAVMIRCLKKSK